MLGMTMVDKNLIYIFAAFLLYGEACRFLDALVRNRRLKILYAGINLVIKLDKKTLKERTPIVMASYSCYLPLLRPNIYYTWLNKASSKKQRKISINL